MPADGVCCVDVEDAESTLVRNRVDEHDRVSDHYAEVSNKPRATALGHVVNDFNGSNDAAATSLQIVTC